MSKEMGKRLGLLGTEIDSNVLQQANDAGLEEDDLKGIQIRDFVLQPPNEKFLAIVANPPYIRHHRLTAQVKNQLRDFSKNLIRMNLDGRAGLHIYFLLRALQLLGENGRLNDQRVKNESNDTHGMITARANEWVSLVNFSDEF